MNKLSPIKIPLLNPNEPEALLAALEVDEGQKIEKDDLIALVETTKSTGEIHAEKAGYLVGLRFVQGDTLQSGEVLAYIGNTPDASDSSMPPWSDESEKTPDLQIDSLRITAPARELALASGLDLSILPQGTLVTRKMVEGMIAPAAPLIAASVPTGEKQILIYGAGGHGRSLVALIQKLGAYQIAGFLDDGYELGEEVYGLKILGGADQLHDLADKGIRMAVNGVGGIGDLQIRLSVFDKLSKAGFFCPTVIHPTAFIEESAALSDGVQVFPFAYVGTEVDVGFGTIINTGAIVSHNCQLGQYVNLSPGATLAGGAIVDEGALVGMRATVNLYVHIGRRARIGNGATVKADVPEGGVVPAGTIWPLRK
ncbi:MAG: NeuD/PglB/VioB family sugar acetyltransferase [Brevefilum sp.]|nr:NeuD/PglB/VioB family sugar acetyltransferase [Brevefilum sp.]